MKENWHEMSWKKKSAVIGLCVFLVVILVSSFDTPSTAMDSSPSPVTPSKNESEPNYTRRKAGDKFVASQDMVLVTNKDDFDELMKVYRSKDTYGLMELITAGKLTFIQPGIELQVIDSSFTMDRVRVHSGDAAGRSGWVPFEMTSVAN